MEQEMLTLKELNEKIQQTIHEEFDNTYWITAEISELKIHKNGHCFLELAEKQSEKGKIIAKMRAVIWAFTFRMLKPYFESTTGRNLEAGLKVMLKVSVVFHKLYNLSLHITDIDPTYTIGEISRQREKIIKQLEEEGVINMNKELELPLVPQKIAIISSETAAGYEDFINQIENNAPGYKLYYQLFQAYMQGEHLEDSVIEALEHIYAYEDFFDAVILIRGGGSRSDLTYFDSYNLALNIAQFPIPVITGIGHEKDESIADIVAHTQVKTPTAAAEFIISLFAQFEENITDISTKIQKLSKLKLEQSKVTLDNFYQNFSSKVKKTIEKEQNTTFILRNNITEAARAQITVMHNRHNSLFNKIIYASQHQIRGKEYEITKIKDQLNHFFKVYTLKKWNELERIYNRKEQADPMHALKKGYSLTLRNGKLLKSTSDVNTGDIIVTRLKDGSLKSKVITD